MKKYTYYPGCSLEKACRPYDESVKAFFKAIDAELNEIDDWNCCGATLSMAIDETNAVYLSARNLAIAEKEGLDLVIPCSACFTALKKAEKFMAEMKEINIKVSENLKNENLSYTGKIKPRHVLDVMYTDLREEIKSRVKKPLSGLKTACYYGCQITRPEGFDDPERPVTMDRLMSDIGAQTVEFYGKSKCCAGMLMQTTEKAAMPMIRDVLYSAKKAGADIIVTACPLCMMNLESYQHKLSGKYKKDLNIPVLYLTQAAGIALGINEKELGIPGNFINPKKVLEKIAGGVS